MELFEFKTHSIPFFSIHKIQIRLKRPKHNYRIHQNGRCQKGYKQVLFLYICISTDDKKNAFINWL